jgi:beta-lactamase regulating signal transducer with metallopeptidase domain
VTAWLAQTLLAVSAAMLLVLALRRPVARACGAGWAYALWLIPAARLVLPPLGLVRLDLLDPPAGTFIPPAGGVTALPPAAAGPGQWVPFMLASWAGGAVIFLILQWLGYRAFLRRLGEDARPARPPFYEGVAILVSRVVDGPVALGLVRRLIVVPADFSRRYSPAERRLAMAHERIHHRHGDLWWNAAALLVLAANWFNPVAWFAFRAFRTDQELACDAAVAAVASADERCAYARALVKAAGAPGLVAACSMSDTRALKRRLRMIARHRVSRLRSGGGLVAVALLALLGFAVGGSRVPVAEARAVTAVAAAPAAKAATVARAEPVPADEDDARPAAAAAPAPAVGRAPRPVLAAAEGAPVPEAAALALPAHESAAPQPAVRVVHAARFVYRLRDLDPARRAEVEQAIAYAVARAGGQSGADGFEVADAGANVRQAVIFRVHFRTSQGENDQ